MYNRLKYQLLVKIKIKIKKFQHPFLAWYVLESQDICACTDGMFEQERKIAVPPDVALERRTKRVIPGFRPVRSLLDAVDPSLLSATDLASRYGIEGEICRPLNHMWQIPRLLTAPDRPCHYNLNVRFRWLIYSKQKSFSLSYGKHWSRALQSVRTRSAKGNIDTCVNLLSSQNFRVITRANIFQPDITFTAKIHSPYG